MSQISESDTISLVYKLGLFFRLSSPLYHPFIWYISIFRWSMLDSWIIPVLNSFWNAFVLQNLDIDRKVNNICFVTWEWSVNARIWSVDRCHVSKQLCFTSSVHQNLIKRPCLMSRYLNSRFYGTLIFIVCLKKWKISLIFCKWILTNILDIFKK